MAYKVVWNYKGELISCILGKYHPYSVIYLLNEFVSAPIGYLFVFKMLEDAISFVNKVCNKDSEIYKCEIKNSMKLEYQSSLLNPSSITKFWNRFPQHPKETMIIFRCCQVYRGTIGAKQIKLVKKVYPKEE